MYGSLNPNGNNHFHQGSVKYYSPNELSKICRQNPEYPSIRDSENFLQMPKNFENMDQEKMRRYHQERDIDEKLRKKMNKEKRRNKKEGRDGTSHGPYFMVANQEEEDKKERKHKRDKKKEFAELNYYDLQCLINDYSRDASMPSNIKKDKIGEFKKHQRSQSIDQIPTKDVTSDQRISRRPDRPRSAERRDDHQSEKNKEYFMKYYSQNAPNNVPPQYDPREQHFIPPNQQYTIQHASKKQKEKSKNRKKTMRENEMPEFVTLDQINEQTMNIRDEKFEHNKHNRWEPEKNVRHRQQREFYGEYNQQQYRNNPEIQNIEHDFNAYASNPEEYNKILQNYYQQPAVNEADMNRTKKKERKKEKNKEQKKKESDKEYKALKKYMKKLAKEQQKETFYFTNTTKDNVEAVSPVEERRQKGKKYLEENLLQFESNFPQNNPIGNIDNTRTYKHARKEFIPIDLGLDELEIPPKHRKIHDHKKRKNKKDITKKESADRMRSASLTVKDKHKNQNDTILRNDDLIDDAEHGLKKYKSETTLDSTINDKNIVCIYKSKDSPEEKEDVNTVKLTKKQECHSLETEKKISRRTAAENAEKEKERSPYSRNHMVLPTEHKRQMSDVLNTQERTILFQKAMKRDFPSRPRPRLSRSRQRSSKYLAKLEDANYSNMKVDEKPTKEVHCYDVGTSTILDNNFGEVLELLKGEPSLKPPCNNKRRSVFHVKKKASREDLVETSRKACDNGEQTMGIVVKGIEPPKIIDTPKDRNRFKFHSEKPKINRLECKILSVVAIAPTTFDNDQEETDPNPIKTQSTPDMQHDTIVEKRNPSTDKRLERLLKYYKVEAQSKISDPSKSSQKTMKEMIANKLTDYLKKLQENDNEDMLQIQTDDPKVVKLVLPIEFTGLEGSKSAITQKTHEEVEKKPRESFSDLYINYSADNNGEDEERLENLELPRGSFDGRFKSWQENKKHCLENLNSTQSFDSRTNQQKSNSILNQNMLNFSYQENNSGLLFSPRLLGNVHRNNPEGDVANNLLYGQNQDCQNSYSIPQTRSANDSTNSYQRNETGYYQSYENLPKVNIVEPQFNQYTNRIEQAITRENVEYNSGPTNIYKNPYEQQINEMSLSNSMKESNYTSPASNLRRSNENLGNTDCRKPYQVEREKVSALYNIIEDTIERVTPLTINAQRSIYNEDKPRIEELPSNFRFTPNFMEDEITIHEINYTNSSQHYQSSPIKEYAQLSGYSIEENNNFMSQRNEVKMKEVHQEYGDVNSPTPNRRNSGVMENSAKNNGFSIEERNNFKCQRNEVETNDGHQEYREINSPTPNRRNSGFMENSTNNNGFSIEDRNSIMSPRNEIKTKEIHQEYKEVQNSPTSNRRNSGVVENSAKNNGPTSTHQTSLGSQQASNPQSAREHEAPAKKRPGAGISNERKKIGKTNSTQNQQQPIENSPPTKGYEYFEIPPPRSKPIKKPMPTIQKFNNFQRNKKEPASPRQKHNDISSSVEPKTGKTSQIPKRITSTPRNSESTDLQQTEKALKNHDDGFGNIESATWDFQKDDIELDNSLQKCLHWNIRNSQTVVMSEFNDYGMNKSSETDKSTLVPRKSNIPIAKKETTKPHNNQGKPSAAKDKNTTMLLTKNFKIAPGQSSYERRKMYDTKIRKNVKRRSLSESSGAAKISPLVYEVRYFNVYNQRMPDGFESTVLGGSKSDQNLSIYSTDFDANTFKKSIESLTTDPSCFLKENEYPKDEVILSTEPSCLLKENEFSKNIEKEEELLTEPSCLLKESKYKITPKRQYISKNQKKIPKKDETDFEETCSNYSSKSERIKELIKENLLYANYPTPKKTKSPNEARKRKKKIDKKKSHSGTKISNKSKSKTKITLRCSKKSSKENNKRLKIVAKLKGKEVSSDKIGKEPESQKDFSQRQNLTKLSIDKVNDNELRVSFGEQKLESAEKEVAIGEKSADSFSIEFKNDRISLEDSVSSKSTVINCKACSSVTSQESKETVKERELFNTSADDSGYLTKGAELNHSGTTINSTIDGKACCSNIFKGLTSKSSERKSGIPRYKHTNTADKSSKWDQKDLVKLRIQLLFPHVYDDFELLEESQNTDLIKYYVESENNILKEAIDSISQKGEMGTRSRSVISLPSVKMIPEEPGELANNGDITSEYSQEGGFYNYQKFIVQNNVCYSANVLSKLSKNEVCGDCSETLKDNDDSETASVISCAASSVKSCATMKRSVVELFKLRPSSAKRSSSSMFSDETLIEENEEECSSMNMNISDEEFFNNFHQIMAMECQKYAKKVRDQSTANENSENALEYEEIPLDCLLKNKNLNSESSEDYLEQEFQLASDEICSKENDSNESTKKDSNESFKSVTCIKENAVKPKKSNSKWQKLLKKKSSPCAPSKMNLDFYPQERMSIIDMIKSVQVSSFSDDSLNCSPREKVLSVISSGEMNKQSEKQFFDNLLAFYDKESELVKKLIREDEFFSSLIEAIRDSEDSTQLIFQKDSQKKTKKEKKRSILSRFFRWKDKKSTETLFENPSIGKSLEFAQSMSFDNATITRESCYSFYRDLEDLDKDTNEVIFQYCLWLVNKICRF